MEGTHEEHAPQGPSTVATPTPEPPPASTPEDLPATAITGRDDEVTKASFYALAAATKEAGELFDRCYEKAELSDKAATVARTGQVNEVQQHEYSIRSFASMAATSESELISLLRELRGLSSQSRRLLSDFKFLAGGPAGDLRTAVKWCSAHDISQEMIHSMLKDTPYAQLDFGLTMASFLELSNKLFVFLQDPEVANEWITWIMAPGNLPQEWPKLSGGRV